ncbi:hypothetical protein CGI25_18320 [Vibrio parahaemolyticus]|nr:hypothetical protein CGI25_18320 [Vibrio parahaemolyticus]
METPWKGALILTSLLGLHWCFVIKSSHCYVEAIGVIKVGKPIENTERMICLMLSLLLVVKASPYSAPRAHLNLMFVAWLENLDIFNVAIWDNLV